uniref:ribokinase n=1 Tax=Myxine glutinosa TaxID=7769 RepID=UPI00358F446E
MAARSGVLDVFVVGSCMMDLVSFTPRLPRPGETIHGNRFITGFGGKGANQCVQASRLGATTAILAKVGQDNFGESYIKNLKENNVNTDFVSQTDGASTGVAQITVDEEGQNSIVIVAGANLFLRPEDVGRLEEALVSSKVLVCQLEVRPETTARALRFARRRGVKTILNPAPATEDMDPELYDLADILCVNETEAEILAKQPVRNVEEAETVALSFLKHGCQAAIITLGPSGCVVAHNGDPTPHHVPSRSVQAIDTTGAGDSFVGALAFYLARRPDLELVEIARRACMVAAVSVTARGTQSSYPYRSSLPDVLF